MNDEKIYSELKKTNRRLDELFKIISFNAGAAMQAKYVYKAEAMAITGLKQTALMSRTVRTLKSGVPNPKGIFRVSKTGKELRFYRPDLEKYVKDKNPYLYGNN